MGGITLVMLLFCISGSLQHQFVPIISKECEHKGYCENVPNYPHDYVDKIIEQLDHEGYIWKSDKVSVADTQLDDGLKPLCKSRKEIVRIATAKHKSGKWYFVIDKYQQFVVRICVQNEAPCGTDLDVEIELDTDANRTQCMQRYIEEFRLSIDENGVLGERCLYSAACCACAVIANE